MLKPESAIKKKCFRSHRKDDMAHVGKRVSALRKNEKGVDLEKKWNYPVREERRVQDLGKTERSSFRRNDRVLGTENRAVRI